MNHEASREVNRITKLSGPEKWTSFRYGCTLLLQRARVLNIVTRLEPRPEPVIIVFLCRRLARQRTEIEFREFLFTKENERDENCNDGKRLSYFLDIEKKDLTSSCK